MRTSPDAHKRCRPDRIYRIYLTPDPVKADRGMKAMPGMKKIDIQGLVDTYEM